MKTFVRRLALATVLFPAIFAVHADNTVQTLPFAQNWTTTTLITTNDNWGGVPGIEGYLGQDITTATGTDPQTLTGVSASGTDLDVIANQSSTTISNGGVAEFDGIANPTIALQPSGTADAPYVLIRINTTGLTGINVAYKLRDLDGTTDNATMPVALQYRVGNAGAFTNVSAAFVVDASGGPSQSGLETPVSVTLPAAVDGQAEVQVRIITANAVGNDEWIGVDDIAITSGVVTPPSLGISNTSAAEGDSGTSAFMFTISLNQPAGAGGVSVDYATADDTATAGNDYTAKNGTATILEGNTSVTVSVDVSGDTTTEASETFFVNLTNPTAGATIGDAQGVGTINNDDVVLTAIHAIQGNGASSPLVGNAVNTRGIVTGRKSNGFFIQANDAEADADPATSEGLFVFTSTTPPAQAAVGNLVLVAGTVVEFVPSQDPLQAPLTELGTVTSVTLLSGGHPLPTAAALTTNLPDPAGALGQLERFEGMRVSAPSFTVVAPTKGNTNEPNATGSSNGIFNVVVTGVARPFREAGIQVPDPDPSGTTATAIPRWDFNPELLTVDSDALGGTQLNVPTGALLTNLVGPLDFGFRRYTILAEAGTTVGVAGGLVPTAARLPSGDEFTVASYNLERFFDTVNDPAIGEPVLTSTAFANRLSKASLAIRNSLNSPDIVGVVEVENLSTLQMLATRISTDAVAAGQPNPKYVAYLEEGNDVGGIDVGFLIKTGEVGVDVPRVEFEDLVQLGKDFTWLDPSDNTQKLLNDRPPLLLQTIIHFVDGRKFPLTTIVVHQRSLNGSTSEAPDGTVTEGFRVRAKRQAQAEFLANQIQLRQTTSDPAERIVVVGDFNAFEFNDGLADAMNVVEGTPTADNETAVNGDGADLVTPDLINLAALEPATERYSFVFDGNAQSLDHVLINEVLSIDAGFDLDHARINADFPETNRNDANSPSRLSDHDPAVAYFEAPPLLFANLATTASATPGSVNVGGTMTFDVTVTNNGPDAAEFVGVGFALDEEIPDLDVTAPMGWTCDTPTVGTGTTILACNAASLANAVAAAFQLTGTAPASALESTINLAVTADAGTDDPDGVDNDATASVDVVLQSTDLALSLTGPDWLPPNQPNTTFQVDVQNIGSVATTGAQVAIAVNIAPQLLQFAATDLSSSCTVDADGNGGTIALCSRHDDNVPLPAGGHLVFQLTVIPTARQLRQPVILISGLATATGTSDPQPLNNQATKRVRRVMGTGSP